MHNTPSAKQLFKHPFRLSVVGSSGSGKSYMISQLMMNQQFEMMKKFSPDKIYILSPTAQVDSSQQQLIKYLESFVDKENIPIFNPEEQLITDSDKFLQTIKNIYEQQIIEIKQDMKNKDSSINKPVLIIMDDLIGAQINMRSGLLPAIMTKLRHGNISCINLLQNIMAVNPQVRMQQTHYIVYNLPQIDEVKKLSKEVAGYKQNEFKQLYQESTQKQYGFLLIITSLPEKYRFFNGLEYQYEI